MKKRVLSILMALSVGLTAMPTVAWANRSSDEDWTDYVEETISFTEGNENALKWIDRIDLPTFAREFYDVLVEASDGDGEADYLMDAKYYSLDEAKDLKDSRICVLEDEMEDGKGTEYIIALKGESFTFKADITEEQKELVEEKIKHYIAAAYTAFDADHPEVFWLYRTLSCGGIYSQDAEDEPLKYTPTLTLADYEETDKGTELIFQKRAQHFLKNDNELYIDGEFINKPDDILTKQEIAHWSTNRANEIIAEFSDNLEGFKAHLTNNGLISEDDTTLDTTDTTGLAFSALTKAGKIAYFDYWLVSHNDYNTDLPNETEESFGGSLDAVSARECISAMVGKRGNQGPVCTGFTRGMKALCDAAQIGCVIVGSIPEEKHTWNYVQVDNGDWFGLDTTWNEAEGEAVTDYLLANKAKMDEGHTVENKGWGNIVFPDTPAIQESRFAFAPGWLVKVDASNERITEIKEVKIDGIVAPVLGEAPVTTGFSINSDTAHVSISKNEENVEIPITWTDAKGASAGNRFAANTVYQAAFMIEPDDDYTFGNNTKVMITGAPEGTEVKLNASNGKVIVTFPATENNAPVFSPNGGSFRGSQTVTITAPDGYEIYYTTDGSLPNQDLTVEGNTTAKYEKEITLTATTAIKAIAVKDDMVSAVAEATFTRKHSSSSSGGGSSTTTKPAEKPAEKPAVLKVPVDTKNVKDVNKLTLAKFNAETGALEFIDSSYDAKEKAVVGHTTDTDDYFVVEKDNLITINLQVGNSVATLNNTKNIMDAAPIISQDRTMVPLRFIAEAFGANVSWNDTEKTVTITMEDKVLTMKIGQELEGFGAAPIISNGRTMVPISYISKELGANVAWIPSTKTVSIAK